MVYKMFTLYESIFDLRTSSPSGVLIG